MRQLRRLAVFATLASVAGCLMHDVNTNPKPPVDVELYDDGAHDADPGRWWTSFGDPDLDRLMKLALEENLQLRQAWARLDQAKAMERAAAAGFFPNVQASLSAGRSQSAPRPFALPGAGEQTVPGVESNNFGASLPVSYELDVWGKVRAGYFAAERDTTAARADVEAAAMTITASVTERWFDVVEQRALRQLLDRQMTVNRTNLELVQLRFGEGDAGLSDIYQQQQQIQRVESQLTLARGQARVAEQQLAVLLGSIPKSVLSSARTTLPDPPPLPTKGIPASMLERRPDVRAAKARVVAADYRVAQAIAARLPSLTLSGSLGFGSADLAELFKSFVWSITGAITGTIWDGGKLDAEVDRSQAVVDERLAAYGEKLLTALVEVESALVQERSARDQIAILERQVDTAQRTLDSARRRFVAGLGNYLSVLTAETSLQAAEQQLLTARRQLLSQRVQVYRALGSHWTRELEPPKKDDKKDRADTKKESPS